MLNEQVPPAVAAAGVPIAVRHQCGKGNREAVAQAYAVQGVEAEVSELSRTWPMPTPGPTWWCAGLGP